VGVVANEFKKLAHVAARSRRNLAEIQMDNDLLKIVVFLFPLKLLGSMLLAEILEKDLYG
jgi:hypothetical protein